MKFQPFCFFVLMFLSLYVLPLFAQTPAFPGAEGFGRYTTGGRGGRVLEVTSLDDQGPGTLRQALESSGRRTVVFRVSGTIALKTDLIITQGDLTIAGQTAPGDGICLSNCPLIVDADNVIIRFLRVRLGDRLHPEADALSAVYQRDLIIDHCSFSWGNDEVLTVRDNVNTTVQWCFITESLHHSCHHKGDHGYGGIWGGMGASFHHNLLAHHTSRNPRFHGSRYHGQPDREVVDFRNNVVYNWGFNSSYGGEAGQQNVVNNYYKAGPATRGDSLQFRIVEPWDTKGRWYVHGNRVFDYDAVSADNWAGGVQRDSLDVIAVHTPFKVAPVAMQSADEAFERVLKYGGAVLPVRDAVDSRIAGEVANGTAHYGGIWGAALGIIDSQDQCEGWPALKSSEAPADSDHDGMPDAWETAHGLDAADARDGALDADGNGYTALEEYLNSLAAHLVHPQKERQP